MAVRSVLYTRIISMLRIVLFYGGVLCTVQYTHETWLIRQKTHYSLMEIRVMPNRNQQQKKKKRRKSADKKNESIDWCSLAPL